MSDKDGIKTRITEALTRGYATENYPSDGDRDTTDMFYEYRDRVCAEVDKFDPAKPKDNIPGYLSYNHGDKRMKTRTGRFLTKKLKLTEKLPENTIHEIADKINAELFAELNIRLDKGSKITDNYEHAVGSSSCMTGGEADCTKLYEANPDRFQQLVMHFISDSARAIVSKLDNGQYLLDRVYSSNISLMEKMHDYAAERGWLWYNASPYYIHLGKKGEIRDFSMIKVSGLTYTDGQVPFMDSFYRYKIVNGKLNIFHDGISNDYSGTLDSTCGNLNEGVFCELCEESYDGDGMRNVRGTAVCEGCLDDSFFYCNDCEEYRDLGERTVVSCSMCNVEVCEGCLDDRYTECYSCGEYLAESCTVTVDGKDELCTECAEQEASVCQDCGDWFRVTHEVDDKMVCSRCLEQYYTCEDCDKHFTIYQVIEFDDEYKCIECAGFGDCKGQSQFEFDDYPKEVTETNKMTMGDLRERVTEIYPSIISHANWGIRQAGWSRFLGEVS